MSTEIMSNPILILGIKWWVYKQYRQLHLILSKLPETDDSRDPLNKSSGAKQQNKIGRPQINKQVGALKLHWVQQQKQNLWKPWKTYGFITSNFKTNDFLLPNPYL